MSSTNTPCAACKFLRRKCTEQCIFAPYFPADNPQRFACVHRVYGPSNVGKLLNELSPSQRADGAKSLAYEAAARLRDPVYGGVGTVYELQQRLKQLDTDLHNGKKALSTYGPQAMQDLQAMKANPNMAKAMMKAMMTDPHPSMLPSMGKAMQKQYQANNDGFPLYGNTNVMATPLVAVPYNDLVIQNAEQELLEAQQLAAAQQQRELMMRTYEQQQQHHHHQSLVAAPHNQVVIHDAEQQELLEAQQLAAAQQQWDLMMRSYEQQLQSLVAASHNQAVIQDAEQQELLEAQQLASAQQPRELMMRTYEQRQHQPLAALPHNQLVIQDAEQQEFLEFQQSAAAQQQQGNFDNVSLDQIQKQQQGAQEHHHSHTHVPHSHPHHAIETHQLLSPQDKQRLEDLLGVFDSHKQSLEDLFSVFDIGHNP